MLYLIDGYNLLHAVGWAPRKPAPTTLEAARTRLLDWLADAAPVRAGAGRLKVVFDAVNGPFPSAGRNHRGVLVEFAYKRTADDAIEELLEAAPVPRAVTVVSNDGRLHESARRCGAKAVGCPGFVDFLLAWTPDPPPPDPAAAEKPAAADPDELAALLAAFRTPKPKPV